MKKLLTLTIVMLALGVAGNALATIDWAGNVWPLHNSNQVPTGPIDVYAQAYKSGVTDGAGQGADIWGELYYASSVDGIYHTVVMTFHGDVGNNDEYTGQIPQAALAAGGYVDSYVIFHDDTDGTHLQITGDQNGNPPPLRYNVTNVLPNDIEVGFRLCLSGEVTTGDVCVIGSDSALGSWGSGVTMNHDGGDLYSVTVVIPAGSNPTFEYKYQKDGCTTWESVGNRIVTLPTDGTTYYPLPDPDSWNNMPIGCGFGQALTEDKTLCFQVCMTGVDNPGGVCVVGNVPELDNWGAGVPMVEIAPDLYQVCITWPAGTLIPLNLEYKFKKDDCNTWESVGNRLFVLDDGTVSETTMTHVWEDGQGACDPVSTERESWGGLKSMYR